MPDAGEWVRRANQRPRGEVEFREVIVEIGSGLGARRLTVRTLREQRDGNARALFCVMKPLPFSNVNYVAHETRGRAGLDSVQLFLPYVRGTLREVSPQKHREGFLGCDFTYLDFRVWLPEEQCRYQVADEGQSAVWLRAGGAAFQGSADVLLDPDDGFVGAIRHHDALGTPTREYLTAGKQVVDGVALPSVMTMTDRRRGHVTTIRLQRAWYDRAIDAGVFAPAFRKWTRDYLETL